MKLKNALAATCAAVSLFLPTAANAQRSHPSHPTPSHPTPSASHGVLVEPFVCSGGGSSSWFSSGGKFFLRSVATSNTVGAQYEITPGSGLSSLSFVLTTPCDTETGPVVTIELSAGGFICVPCTQAIQQSLGHGAIRYTFTAAQLGISPGVPINSLFVAFYPSSTNISTGYTLNGVAVNQDLNSRSTSCPSFCENEENPPE